MLISETHFTTKTYFYIPGYKLCHTNHPDGSAHGGTAIIVKDTIKFYELLKYEEQAIQATSIKVQGILHEITVAAVYCPPRHNIKKEQFKTFFHTLGPRFIAGGDYNSKNVLWGSRLTTTKGRELSRVLHENNYSYLSTGTPTYWPTDAQKIPDLLDLFITNGISTSYVDIQASLDLTSDHSPIIATINTTISVRQTPPRLHNSQTNWESYRALVRATINPAVKLKEQEDVQIAIDNFTCILQHAAKVATPCRNPQRPTNTIPSNIKKLVAVKRKARSNWQKTHTPESRHIYNQASNKLKQALHDMKNASFTEYISNLKRDDNSIWKPIRNKRRPETPNPPIRVNTTPPGPWAKSDKDKADLFANYLSEVFTPYDQALDQDIEQELAKPIQPPEHLPAFSLQKLKQEIKMLNPRKAPGMDLITAQMLKELPHEGLVNLLHIFNAILRCSYWPTSLKKAQIIMILKPGKDPTDVSSYRPISLLPTISKVLEKLIYKQLTKDTDQRGWIPHHQFGFRRAHSTIQQCHRLTDTINKAIEDHQYCTAAFLDISQAFDKVWHPGLLFKIKRILPPGYYNLMKSYLHDRTYKIKFNTETSTLYQIHSGVPQGSILGPLLYTLYTSDLPTSQKTVISTFADDTAIVAKDSDPMTASKNLQDHLTSIEKWLQKWRIKVNQNKSTHITFTIRKGQCPPIRINQTTIPQGSTVKYLGLHLDSKLTWREHITKKRKQLDLKTREINWLIGKNSPLSLENKILIYKTVLKPIWTYGIALWGCASKSNISVIQRYQSKLLRTITNAPWYVTNQTLHSDLHIPYVHSVLQDYIHKHRSALESHPNPLVEPLIHTTHTRRLKRRWTFDAIN